MGSGVFFQMAFQSVKASHTRANIKQFKRLRVMDVRVTESPLYLYLYLMTQFIAYVE